MIPACLFAGISLFPGMAADGAEGFVADDMLNPAGILGRGFFVHPQMDQHIPDDDMPLIYLFRSLPAQFRQGQVAVRIRSQIAALLQKSHAPAAVPAMGHAAAANAERRKHPPAGNGRAPPRREK